MKMIAFGDIVLCSLEVDWCFRELSGNTMD
jgi:hypothetical protein